MTASNDSVPLTIEAMLDEAALVTRRVSRSVDTRHLVVVYQFGKVASTSIVSSLAERAGVEVVQAHFLGSESFTDVIDLLLDPYENDYPQLHLTGQLVSNIAISREIEAFRSGLRPGARLSVLALVRDPIEWFRSSLLQDIEWHLPLFRLIHAEHASGAADDEDAITFALPIVCGMLASLLDDVGGIDLFVAHGNDYDALLAPLPNAEKARLVRNFAAVFIRPFSWFDVHFVRFLKIGLDELAPLARSVLKGNLDPGIVYIVRYEHLEAGLSVVAEDMGLSGPFVLRRENVSAGKEFDEAIRAGFQSVEVERLRLISAASSYARRFQYA
jgi:hypothetical protein